MKKIVFSMLAISMLLIGCGQKTVASNTSTTNVGWASVPSNEQQAILNVSKRYGDNQPKVVRVVQTITEQYQPMYLVFLSGHFHEGNTQHENLEFSILADGSEFWAVSFYSIPISNTSVENPQLPSWLFISSNDVSSISIQGWGPGADGNFAIYPASSSSGKLISTVIDGLSQAKEVKPYRTGSSLGGAESLELKMKNGTSILFATFPNEPKPIQYIVTLNSSSGQQEKSAMISDASGKVTLVLDEIAKGKLVRQKTH